jgi:hypothetical protein
MRTSKPLRRPFILSVCALVGSVAPMLNGGCGGHTDEACPGAQPMTGSACSLASSVECTYGGPDSCGNPPTVSCVGGRWETEVGSCNPPAMIPDGGPLAQVCPAPAPVAGGPCSVSPTLTCPYNINACGQATESFTCTGGSWVDQPIAGGCNPPAPLPEAGPDGSEAGDAPETGSDAGTGAD